MNHDRAFNADTTVLLAELHNYLKINDFYDSLSLVLQNSGYVPTQPRSLVLESHIFIIPLLGGPSG